MPYDAEKALATVSLLAAQPMALGAHPSFPAKSIADLIKLAKSKPHSLSYGTAGIGSGGYLAGEIMKSMAGVDIVHIGYKGGNNAMVDVMANQIPLVFTGLPNLLPQMKAGKIAILGITGAKRSPVAPDIPTIGETVPGYHFDNWFGLVAPRGTPAAVLARLDTDSNAALRTPEVKNRLLTAGFVLIGTSRRAFAKTLKEDTVTFADVIRKAGLVVN
jgi:tripartite-type tricarboxylate transporter receptor subunit TctC